MIGLIVLAIGILLLIGYGWLLIATNRFVKRRTGSRILAWLAVAGILFSTFVDTVFNRWYHKEVLCNRDDVGVKIFETVKLPSELWDEQNNLPRLPSSMTTEAPFLERYADVEKYDRSGWWPLTAHIRYETGVIDVKTGRMLSRFVNYEPAGGMWWSFPLSLFGETTTVGWLMSREQVPSCFQFQRDGSVQARRGPFERE